MVTPVLLFGPRVRPIVLSRPRGNLTPAQLRVVMSLLDAAEGGLCMARLLTASGDVINVLNRLSRPRVPDIRRR